MNTETKIKTYKVISTEHIQKSIQNENMLGYQVVSTNNLNNTYTVTYQRDKNLKFYKRLKDLERKINKVDELTLNIDNDIESIKLKKANGLKKEKYGSWFLLYVLVLIDVIIIINTYNLITGNSGIDILGLLTWIIVMVAAHAIQIYWMKLIKRRSDVVPYEEARNKLYKQKQLLLNKANAISKE